MRQFHCKHEICRDRFLKLAVLGYMWDISFFIATPIGAELFSYGGYILVFSAGLGKSSDWSISDNNGL